MKKDKKQNLTLKQEKFCHVYIETGNATEAYRQAYSTSNMKPETVNRNAKTLIDNSKISARIAELKAPAIEKAKLTAEYVLNNIIEIGERCMQKVPVMVYDRFKRRYVQAVEVVEKEDGTLEEKGVWTFQAIASLKAQELLGKHLGIIKNINEHTGKDGGPIETKVTVEDARAKANRLNELFCQN